MYQETCLKDIPFSFAYNHSIHRLSGGLPSVKASMHRDKFSNCFTRLSRGLLNVPCTGLGAIKAGEDDSVACKQHRQQSERHETPKRALKQSGNAKSLVRHAPWEVQGVVSERQHRLTMLLYGHAATKPS